jgi:hypothetical protein
LEILYSSFIRLRLGFVRFWLLLRHVELSSRHLVLHVAIPRHVALLTASIASHRALSSVLLLA